MNLIFFTALFSLNAFAEEPKAISHTIFGGTGWLFSEGDHDKKIILLEKDQTFTFLNLISKSGNEGELFSDSTDTWTINDQGVVVLSFSDGYKICSLEHKKNTLSGTCINRPGLVENVKGRKIE